MIYISRYIQNLKFKKYRLKVRFESILKRNIRWSITISMTVTP